MDDHQPPRTLSYDEKHAAEAAFNGRPFNPRWSARARLVYDGILNSLPASARLEEPSSTDFVTESASTEQPEDRPADRGDALPASIPFQKAIESGALIDVTPAAKQLGLSFSVTVTKPLWDAGIAPVQTLTSEEQAARLRDVLMAFRLRLAGPTCPVTGDRLPGIVEFSAQHDTAAFSTARSRTTGRAESSHDHVVAAK